MNRKGSYRSKFIEKSGEPSQAGVVREKLIISEEGKKEFEEGKVILLDKPPHWTSFDVVKKLRNIIRIKKIGHAGTLDPLATGLLIICTGKFTKQINSYMNEEKEYSGSITLGAVTPTYDLESEPGTPKEFMHLTESMIREAAQKFTGNIDQFPPMFSAIKKEGTPLYMMARRGEDVKLESRKITIREFRIDRVELPVIYFTVACSTGTYIRSLAHDLGQELGCGGYLSSLRRIRSGGFNVSDALTPEGFISDLKEKGIIRTDN